VLRSIALQELQVIVDEKRQMKKYIVINATAIGSSGALSILKQFIEAIPIDNFEYLIFTHNNIQINVNKPNVNLIAIRNKSLHNRFIWDAYGLQQWLKNHNIEPSAAISMQNTNFRTSKPIPNFIYYHQSIPFFKRYWNPFKSNQKTLFFYKNIYPFFVRLLLNQKTEIFVQTNFMKKDFASYFNFPLEKIHIISPKVLIPTVVESPKISIDLEQFNLFFPAQPFVYKNHKIVFNALNNLDKELQKKITLHLTCDKEDLLHLYTASDYLFHVNYLGNISFEKVLSLYKNADALLFPSLIESLGLPLIEAASFGIPIIAADLPYAREVLSNYAGARFASHNDFSIWKEEILKLIDAKKQRYQPLKIENADSWQELFNIVKNKID
jgi:glycosyltransferase involved in cell wall biosynthesis